MGIHLPRRVEIVRGDQFRIIQSPSGDRGDIDIVDAAIRGGLSVDSVESIQRIGAAFRAVHPAKRVEMTMTLPVSDLANKIARSSNATNPGV